MAASAEQGARYRNFFEDFFADAELRNEEQEEVNEILEAVMIAGDVNEIQQAPNNREFEIDVEEGWKSDSDAVINMPFLGRSQLNIELPDDPQPLDFFKLFSDGYIINLLVDETNKYAQKKKIDEGNLKEKSRLHRWTPVSAAEMRVFLSLVITTGLVIKPTIEEYWDQDDVVHTPFFPKNMSHVRFQSILSNFHIADNANDDRSDPLFKVRPFITHLKLKFMSVYSSDRDISELLSVTLGIIYC